MSREEIEKLLGGYATDTLSEAERRALFQAALEDQELFDSLAREQALREVLSEPSARQQLIEALGPAREPFAARIWLWLRRPATLAMAGGVAVLFIVAGLVLRPKEPALRQAAMVEAFQPPPAPKAKAAPPLPNPPRLIAARKPAERLLLLPEMASPPPPATPGPAEQQVVRQSLEHLMARLPAASVNRPKAIGSMNPGVKYSLLLKGANGEYSAAAPGAVFRAGDSVRLQVAPSEAGYIYLFERREAAGWNLIESQPAGEGQSYMLPATGGLESEQPGRMELWLVFSRAEQGAFPADQTYDVDALAAKAQASVRITLEYR